MKLSNYNLRSAIQARAWELAQIVLGGPGKPEGPNAVYCVPWREDNKPSLKVLRESNNGHDPGFWRDFGRDESGDIFELVARANRLDCAREFPKVELRATCSGSSRKPHARNLVAIRSTIWLGNTV